MSKVIVKLFFPVLVFILGAFASVFTSPTPASAQACTTPAQVINVEISYPSCVGDQCNFTQASCSWGATTGAANYQVTATEVETGTVVYNQQVAAATTNVAFSITQNKTYKCDISAINSCGTAGPIGTHSLLCAADAAVTVTPVPPTPTLVVKPTVPPVGSSLLTMSAAVAVILLVAGVFVFLI